MNDQNLVNEVVLLTKAKGIKDCFTSEGAKRIYTTEVLGNENITHDGKTYMPNFSYYYDNVRYISYIPINE